MAVSGSQCYLKNRVSVRVDTNETGERYRLSLSSDLRKLSFQLL